MLPPAHVNMSQFFLLFGNIPAASPNTPTILIFDAADILLRGCGDVRHILFLIYTMVAIH